MTEKIIPRTVVKALAGSVKSRRLFKKQARASLKVKVGKGTEFVPQTHFKNVSQRRDLFLYS